MARPRLRLGWNQCAYTESLYGVRVGDVGRAQKGLKTAEGVEKLFADPAREAAKPDDNRVPNPNPGSDDVYIGSGKYIKAGFPHGIPSLLLLPVAPYLGQRPVIAPPAQPHPAEKRIP
jgi:hypothetical protein